MGMMNCFSFIGHPSGKQLCYFMQLVLVSSLSPAFFGSLVVITIFSASRGKMPSPGKYLFVSVALGLIDLIAILLCSRVVLDDFDPFG